MGGGWNYRVKPSWARGLQPEEAETGLLARESVALGSDLFKGKKCRVAASGKGSGGGL